MNCANHPDIAATAFCRTCGKPLCTECQRPVNGTVVCEDHIPAATPPPPPPSASVGNPYVAPAGSGIGSSPGLAFVLGLIPGVGAVYNGQYAKGLVHALVFGILVSIASSGAASDLEPLFGIFTAAWVFYMAFEAYHTAARRRRGEVVDEFSSILPMPHGAARTGVPVGPIIMIVLGVVFLLNTLNIVRLHDILRFWPVFLIALGCYMLWVRLTGGADDYQGGVRQ